MTTDFRFLCAQLVELWDAECDTDVEINELCAELRAALAEPEPEEPTDKELAELYRKAYYECENRQGDVAQVFALRAVLARWGK